LSAGGAGGVSTGGTFNVANGATLDLANGGGEVDNNAFAGSYTGSGPGLVLISGTLVIGSGGATFNVPLIQWQGDINLQGNTLTNAGGVVTLINQPGHAAYLEAANNTNNNLGGTLINQGTIIQQGGGDLGLYGSVQINNQAGATYDFAADGNIYWEDYTPSMSNAGTVEKTGGTGTSSIQVAFSNSGFVQVQSGTLKLSGGLPLGGAAAIAESASATLSVAGNMVGSTKDASLFAPQGTVQLTGSGPQLLEAMSQDLGNVAAGFAHNFAYGTLDIAGSVQLVDHSRNSGSTGPEALYVDTLIVEQGATLDLNGLHAYARAVQINGQLIGGTVNPPPDGGPMVFDTTAPGTISPAGEVDNWTFFGRAGQGVSVTLATGSGGSPAPLSPTLNYGKLTILDPNGNVVASTSNTQTGAGADLLGVTLPADGIYQVRVQAPPAQTASVGNYVLGLFDATVHNAPVNFDEPVDGQLGTQYNVDHWTFGAAANQQVSLHVLGAAPGVEFDLTGPGAATVFSGLTADSGPVTLPASGIYTLTVHAVGGRGGAYAFNLEQISQTVLTLGTPYNGTLAGSAEAQLFQVNVTASEQLLVTLTDASAADHNELYAKFGAPPTRALYDYRFQTPASANQRLLVPAAAPGTWYILLYGDSVPAASSYTLTASAAEVLLTGSTPARGSTASDTTLTLQGAGFNLVKNVDALATGGASYQASAVTIVSPEKLTATFPAGTLPAGNYAIQVSLADGTTARIPGALNVVQGGQPNFQVQLIVPNPIGYHIASTIYVQYSNTGDGPMPAPLLSVTGVMNAKQGALLTLDASRQTAGFWTSATPDGFSQSVQFLASGATPGILQPGESETMPVYYAGWLHDQWDFSRPPIQFSVGVLTADITAPIDWAGMQASLRPPVISAAAWGPIFTNLMAETGNTCGSFVALLDTDAGYLAQLGENVNDISRLFSFAIQQADGLSPYPVLHSAVDAQVAAPGLSLSFQRAFLPTLSSRYQSGPLGFGWVWTGGWQRTLAVANDGTVTISDTNGSERIFQPDSRGSDYFAQAGDHGTLTNNGDGTYTLTEANGLSTNFRADGRVDYLQDTNGNRITAVYTGGLLTSLTHSSGQSLQIAYNAAGLIKSVTDSDQRVTGYGYDASNQHLLSVTAFDGRTTSYTYDNTSNPFTQNALRSIAYPDGTQSLFQYDAQGRLAGTQRDGGAEPVTFTYHLGQITTTDALGDASRSFFDDRGLLVRSIDPLGDMVTAAFDNNGNLTQLTDPAGQTYHYTYDANGDLLQSTDPLGHTNEFIYTSSFARLSSFTDANGNTTQFFYDGSGNLTSTTYADGTVESLANYPLGNVKQSVGRRGQAIGYTYDKSGRLLTETFSDGSQNSYGYDAHGNLTSATDSSGTITLTYDAHDQLSQITYPSGRFLHYSYDAGGRRTQMIDQDGFTVNYHYDDVGRLAGLTDGSGKAIVTYTYDLVGRLARKDMANGTYTTYAYDAAGQIWHLVNNAPGGAINSRFDYTYDALGRASTMTTLDGQWTYSYDAIGELAHAVFASNNPSSVPNQDLQYVYDAAGNRVSTTINGVTTQYVANNLNEYTSIGSQTLSYDKDGNLISQTDSSGTTRFTYDALNRLAGVTSPGGGGWTYQYDAFGNRVASIHDGQPTEYLIDPGGLGNIVGEYSAGNAPVHYTYGLGLVSRAGSGQQGFYDFDALGSTAGLSGASGTYVGRYSYLPFGQILHSTLALANPFAFAGQAGISADGSGLLAMRQRDYAPGLGQFLTNDPLGLLGSDTNFRRYAGNDPLNGLDPSGLSYSWEPGGWASIQSIPATWVLANTPVTYAEITYAAGDVPVDMLIAGEFGAGAAALPVVGALTAFAAGWGAGKGLLWLYPPLGSVFGDAVYDLLHPDEGPAWLRETATGLHQFLDGLKDDLENFWQWVVSVFSKDPNDKYGPGGFGPSHFVAANVVLPYRIDFENDPKASAPAQSVTISDQLDPNLNWSTFRLTEIGFGNTIIQVPAGSQHYQTTVNTTENGKTFQVEVEAGIHPQTGQVYASFYSIDPATGLPPDALTGFLPPEDGKGDGMGHVSYTILAKAGLATGTQIRNVALVTFDVNPAIATDQKDDEDPTKGTDPSKQALVTIDSAPPSSQVSPLAATSPSSFTVSWSGSDGAGPGIASYNVYVSDNGGPFTPWQSATTATSATYTGKIGHTYAFYSVATDNVGLVQPTPSSAQATTKVVKSGQALPTVISEQVLFNRKVLTGFSFRFSTAMNPATAGKASNYQVDWISTKRVKGKVVTVLNPIAVTVQYVAASHSARLILSGNQTFAQGGQITVIARPPKGVSSASGVFLDGGNQGRPGDNGVFTILPYGRGLILHRVGS
jgi:RHS repeat-associated protein